MVRLPNRTTQPPVRPHRATPPPVRASPHPHPPVRAQPPYSAARAASPRYPTACAASPRPQPPVRPHRTPIHPCVPSPPPPRCHTRRDRPVGRVEIHARGKDVSPSPVGTGPHACPSTQPQAVSCQSTHPAPKRSVKKKPDAISGFFVFCNLTLAFSTAGR